MRYHLAIEPSGFLEGVGSNSGREGDDVRDDGSVKCDDIISGGPVG
jgi:hypothetical protein